ncbi:MAG: hypothetical protein ABSE62_01685 [Chthoniobacteraceae bacterium]|jgi:hypothetical protein
MNADILAGQEADHLGDSSYQSGDASIGAVTISGDFIASNIVAGIQNVTSSDTEYGNANDSLIPTGGTVIPSIASVIIAGQALGDFNNADQFGIVAETIGSIKVSGSTIPLPSGMTPQPLGITGNLDIHIL